MKLSNIGLADRSVWEAKSYELPVFASIMCAEGPFSQQFEPAFVEENQLQPLLLAIESVQMLGVDYVPRNSLVREFIGGSSLLV